jgi:hypothetical protein
LNRTSIPACFGPPGCTRSFFYNSVLYDDWSWLKYICRILLINVYKGERIILLAGPCRKSSNSGQGDEGPQSFGSWILPLPAGCGSAQNTLPRPLFYSAFLTVYTTKRWDLQVAMLKEERANLMSENEELYGKVNSSLSTANFVYFFISDVFLYQSVSTCCIFLLALSVFLPSWVLILLTSGGQVTLI